MRSESDSSVRSDSGRNRRVSAISNARREFVVARSSFMRSPNTESARLKRSVPNNSSSDSMTSRAEVLAEISTSASVRLIR